MTTITWTGANSTHFNDPLNWNPALPGTSDDVIIAPGAPVTINSPVSFTINSLSMSANVTLAIATGTTFIDSSGTNGSGNAGVINIANASVFRTGGSFVNSGTINANAAGSITDLQLDQSTVLSGGGKVVLGNDPHTRLFGLSGAFVLDNVNNQISGAGSIFQLQLINEHSGVINANQSANALAIDLGANPSTNAGILEATSGGDLSIANTAITNVGGTIQAVGAGSTVALLGGATVIGGLLTSSGSGVISSSGAALDGLPVHPVTNNGTIQIPNAANMSIGGTITNNGVINLLSTGGNTDLRLFSPIVTLNGTGSVHLTGSGGASRIFGNAANFQLINQNTIDGTGQLGAAQMTFTNSKLVNANQSTALTLDTTGNLAVNAATLEGSGTGGLLIQNTNVKNTGGTITVLAGSHVDLKAATIFGGKLTVAAGGSIDSVTGNGGLDGITYGALTTSGLIKVSDQTIMFLAGTINNTGTILDNQTSGTGSTDIRIASQTVTLGGAGGGKLVLSNAGNLGNRIFSTDGSGHNTLVNVNNTISGAGQIGVSGSGQLTLVNQANGVINADQPHGVSLPGQLILDTRNAPMINAGLLEATNTGGLVIQATLVQNSGTVQAVGASAHVDLAGSTIQGGKLSTASGGTIDVVTGNGGIDGLTLGSITNAGLLLVNSQTQLDLAGTINNTGTIKLDQEANTGNTNLRVVSQSVTLMGGGKVILGGTTQTFRDRLFGASGSNQLVNVDNTISGAGQIGDGSNILYFVNQGTVNANDANGQLSINTGTDLAINQGILQDIGAQGLVLQSAINNNGGTIQAIGNSSAHVDLQGAYIEGGTLKTANNATIDTVAADTRSVLDGITSGILDNEGLLQVVDNSALTLVGTITNNATIALNSGGSNTDLKISGNAVLQGGGTVALSNFAQNRIYGVGFNPQFTNNELIKGAGQIGVANTLYFINNGTVSASQQSGLLINTAGAIAVNTGTLQANNTSVNNGGLVLQSAINNQGGTIQSVGANSHVNLDGAYIEGGTLSTGSGGVIETVTTNSGALDGITEGVLANKGTVVVNDLTTLRLVGTINNTGTINEVGFSGNTKIRIDGQSATLTGAGKVIMGDNAANIITANATTGTLINQGNTISGAGQFGNGQLNFINGTTAANSGIIRGDGSNALNIALGSGDGLNQSGGQIIATGSGGVQFVSGFFTNLGTMAAQNGSALVFQGGAANTKLGEGDLVGGTWKAIDTGAGATLDLSGSAAGGGSVVQTSGTLVLQGANAEIQSFDSGTLKPIELTLQTIATGGQLQLLSGRSYTTGLNITDGGQIKLTGGTFSANALSINASGSVLGSGTVSNAPLNNGKIEANGGLLDISGDVTGTGTLQIDNVSTIELGGHAAEPVVFAAGGVGTLKIDTANQFTGNITGVALGDVIDLANIAPANITSISWLNNAPKLIVLHNSTTLAAYPSVTGAGTITPSNAHWVVTSDGAGGSNLTLTGGASTAAVGGSLGGGGSGGLINGIDPAWNGSVSTDFDTAANWTPNVIPGAADDAVIGSGFNVVSTGNNSVNSLSVGTGSTLTETGGTFAIISGTDPAGNAGTLAVASGAILQLAGTIVNSGSITGNSTGNNTDIVLTSGVVLKGGGKVVLLNNAANHIRATNAAFVLDNFNNTLSGGGTIGEFSSLTLNNESAGIINANNSGVPLTLDTGASVIANAGLFEATGGGDLVINSAVNNTGGTITAVGAGSTVSLTSVTGGTVTGSGGGHIQLVGNGLLDGTGLHPLTLGTPIAVSNSQSLTLLGTIINNSTISLNSTGNNTDLRVGNGTNPVVTLKGTGTIALGNNINNRIYGTSSSAFVLDNQSNKIVGAGQLGSAQMTFSNEGLVDATSATTALILRTDGQLATNSGTLRASGAGGLSIQNTAVVNTGGTVLATAAGSHVDLSGGSIQGGTLAGLVQTVSGNGGIDGITSGVLNNTGTVLVNDLTTLSVAGVINNTGTIKQNQTSSTGATTIHVVSQNVTLQGGGKLTMSNNTGNLVFGDNGVTLTNVDNVISGAGQIGEAAGHQLFLVNQAGGIINANLDPTATQAGALFINPASAAVANAGTMEATAAGGLILQANVQNTGTGIIKAVGTTALGAAHVDLNGATIQGGTLATSGGGVIQATGNGVASGLDGSSSFGAVNNTGTLVVTDQASLNVAGIINNSGTIQLDQESSGSGSGTTRLGLTSQLVTLQGGGQIALSNNTANLIIGSNVTLDNIDNLIRGAGQIGANTAIDLRNEAGGRINADQTSPLFINLVAGSRVTNHGTMQATSSGGLIIQSVVNNGTDGVIQATGTSALGASHVDLASAYIEGGLLTTSAGGVIQATDTGSTLDGLTSGMVTNAGVLSVNNTDRLGLVGTINNTGTIMLAGTGGFGTATILRVDGQAVTLQGGGSVLMSDNARNQIKGNNGTFQLVNVDNTIAGSGQLGVGATVFLTNSAGGVINANQNNALVVGFDVDLMTNLGTMESTGTGALNGGLVFSVGTVDNAGGTIEAVGAAAHVELSAGATIEGGLLTTAGGGVIETTAGAATTSFLDGVSEGVLTNSGLLRVSDNSTLKLTGTINNTGTIQQSSLSANTNTDMRIYGQAATLTGSGSWILSDAPNNRVFSDSSGPLAVLTNNGNTIRGAGQFGTGQLEFINQTGSVIADGVNALVFGLGSGNGVNNATMSAIGAGGMILSAGIFTNNGTMAANSSAITYQSGMTNTNLAEGVLTGGTWKAIGSGTLSLTGGPINVDNAIIVMQGVGSAIQAGSGAGAVPYTPIEQTLTSILAGKQLQILNRGYTSFLDLDNSGTILLSGNTSVFQTNSLTIEAGALLKGSGTVGVAVANAGTVESNGGTLTLNGAVFGTGELLSDVSSALLLNGSGNSAGTLVANGIVTLGSGDNLTVSGAATDGGTINVAGGVLQAGTLTVAAAKLLRGFGTVNNAVIDNGLVEANGGTLGIAGAVSGAGTLQADSGAVLVLNGATNATGKLVDTGTVRLGSGDNLTVNSATSIGGTMQVNGGTLHANSLTLAASGILSGSGSVTDAIPNSGLIEANGGTLTITGAVTGTGTVQADGGAVLVLNGAANTAGALVDNGTVRLGAAQGLTVNSAATIAGTMQVNGGTLHANSLTLAAGGTLSGFGSVTDAIPSSGRIEASGGTLNITGAVTGTGTLQADSGAMLTLGGVSNAAASVLNNGTVNVATSHTLDVTGSVNPASTGVFALTNASLLEVAADTGASNQISFLGATGDTLAVDAVASFGTNVGLGTYAGPLLKGFSNTVDKVDLKNLVFNSGTNVATIDGYTAGTGLLQLHSGTTKATLLFNNADLAGGSFHLSADSGTGTVITHS